MKKNDVITALEPVLKVLEELSVLYYVSGSIASSAYGIARSTLDVDMVMNLSPYHIQSFTDKLKDKYYIDADMIAEAIRTNSSFNIIHLDTMLKIDVFILNDQPYSLKVFERKVKDKLDNDSESISIYLCTPEDIILNKLLWYKSGGEVSEKQWNDIKGVIKVQENNLDKEYLKHWSLNLGILKLLNNAFNDSGINF